PISAPLPPPISTPSLHDALPIYSAHEDLARLRIWRAQTRSGEKDAAIADLDGWIKKRKPRADDREFKPVADFFLGARSEELYLRDRKSTRLNSSHGSISYAVFCF